MRARKKLPKSIELKPLLLKIRTDIQLKWKSQAAKEKTTMSELAERLILDYLKQNGGR